MDDRPYAYGRCARARKHALRMPHTGYPRFAVFSDAPVRSFRSYLFKAHYGPLFARADASTRAAGVGTPADTVTGNDIRASDFDT